MPRWGRAAAAVLMALILCLAASAACAAMHEEIVHPALEMEARVGYDGVITYGKAIPLRVRIMNHGEEFEGVLAVNAYVNKKEYDRFEVPVTLPASVYGILLLFAALCLGIVKVEQVKEAGTFLTGIMSVLFVPPVVGILEQWALIKDSIVVLVLLAIATTITTFYISGGITQHCIGSRRPF